MKYKIFIKKITFSLFTVNQNFYFANINFFFRSDFLIFKMSELYREQCDNNKEGNGEGEGVPMSSSVIHPVDNSSFGMDNISKCT